ncbi:MAG: hypothetical protein IJ794_11205 [Lachnospiraceae bacterium]|nr:hypothetical protein [Lachnospiraceae bacterium]
MEDNRTGSLNCNKTAEELFGSSSDEDGEWVTEYLADNEKGSTGHDTK